MDVTVAPLRRVLFGLVVWIFPWGSQRIRGAPSGEVVAKIRGRSSRRSTRRPCYCGSPGTLAVLPLALGRQPHPLDVWRGGSSSRALGGTLALGATFVVVPIVQIIKSVPLAPLRPGIGEAAFAMLLPLCQETADDGRRALRSPTNSPILRSPLARRRDPPHLAGESVGVRDGTHTGSPTRLALSSSDPSPSIRSETLFGSRCEAPRRLRHVFLLCGVALLHAACRLRGSGGETSHEIAVTEFRARGV